MARSIDDATSRFESEKCLQSVTHASETLSVRMCASVPACHTRTVPFSSELASSAPSLVSAMDATGESCPLNVASSRPLSPHHTLISVSSDPVITRCPSASYAMQYTMFIWPFTCGPQPVSVAAAAVGLSTTSVTYYFKRKDELAAACLMRGVDWLDHVADEALGEAEPEARLRRMLAAHLERLRQTAAGEAPPLPILSDIRALNPPHRTDVFQAYTKVFRKMRQIFDAPDLAWLTRGRRTARTRR